MADFLCVITSGVNAISPGMNTMVSRTTIEFVSVSKNMVPHAAKRAIISMRCAEILKYPRLRRTIMIPVHMNPMKRGS